jgi:hypothetical protein
MAVVVVLVTVEPATSSDVSVAQISILPVAAQDWKGTLGVHLEYTDIPKEFFTPHHVGYYYTNFIRGHC